MSSVAGRGYLCANLVPKKIRHIIVGGMIRTQLCFSNDPIGSCVGWSYVTEAVEAEKVSPGA